MASLPLKKLCPAWLKDSQSGKWFTVCRPKNDKWDPSCGPCVLGCFPNLYCLKPTARRIAIKEFKKQQHKTWEDAWYRGYKKDRKEVRSTLLSDFNDPYGVKLLKKLIARDERRKKKCQRKQKVKRQPAMA